MDERPKADRRITLLTMVLALLLSVTFLYGCDAAEPETTTQVIEDVTAEEANELIQENEGNPDFMIIDVRTPEEYAEGHIDGSLLIDINGDDFEEKIGQLDREGTHLVYCRSGSRSRRAVDFMQEQGFQEVYNMLGGIGGWTTAGFPTVE